MSNSTFSRRGLLAGLATMATAQIAASQSFQQPRMASRPHIDVHIHPIGGQQRLFKESVQRCLSEMDRFGITKGVIMSPPQAPYGFYDFSDFLSEIRPHAKRQIATVNATR